MRRVSLSTQSAILASSLEGTPVVAGTLPWSRSMSGVFSTLREAPAVSVFGAWWIPAARAVLQLEDPSSGDWFGRRGGFGVSSKEVLVLGGWVKGSEGVYGGKGVSLGMVMVDRMDGEMGRLGGSGLPRSGVYC